MKFQLHIRPIRTFNTFTALHIYIRKKNDGRHKFFASIFASCFKLLLTYFRWVLVTFNINDTRLKRNEMNRRYKVLLQLSLDNKVLLFNTISHCRRIPNIFFLHFFLNIGINDVIGNS